MKAKPAEYAQALLGVLKDAGRGEEGQILKRFLGLVRQNSDWSLLPKVLDALERALVKKQGGRVVAAEFARPNPLPAFLKSVKRPDILKTKINPGLLAGVRVTIDGELEADFSFARKLNKLFSKHGA